jgi:hypothetical protein
MLYLSRAVEAATTIAHRLGSRDVTAAILRESRYVSPMNVVARVFPIEDEGDNERPERKCLFFKGF